MKKNSLLYVLGSMFVTLLVSSCITDEKVSNEFKGKYTVKITSINLKDLEKASREAQAEIAKGKEELKENLEKAQKELDENGEITINGKKANLKELVGELGDGLGKIMEGIDDISNGFGDLGKNITESVIKNTSFQAEFLDKGKLTIGSDNNSFNFNSKKLTWEIKDSRLFIKSEDSKDDDFSFEMKAKSDNEWELINDKMVLQLHKVK